MNYGGSVWKKIDNRGSQENFMPYCHTNLKQDPYLSRIHQESSTRKHHLSRHKNADTMAVSIHPYSVHTLEKLVGMQKDEPFKGECNRIEIRKKLVHDVKQNMTAEKQMDTVNFTSFKFNSIQLVRTIKLKTNNSQNSLVIPSKADTGSDGNTKPYLICKTISHGIKHRYRQLK